MQLQYSFIIPVYNRPQEITELLESFSLLKFDRSFEIVIIEDGSTEPSNEIVSQFSDQLTISYYSKPNSGPGDSRNYGMRKATGNYFIILDSDCILPPEYLYTVDNFLKQTYIDCFGGADAAHKSFTALQKAINYTMTSLFTTGGIRGSKKAVQKFEPRSFNMGISQRAFEATTGFARIHPGEDPDLSHRIKKAGFETVFIPGAAVFHKRRISWKKFYQQVRKFGLVRPILSKWHPISSKITFWFPTLFVVFVLASILLALSFGWLLLLPLIAYCLLIFLDSSIKNKNIYIGLLSVVAMFVQFVGYGIAFWKSTLYIHILGKDPEVTFPKLFFKK
ncbi:glycosyltransferase [Patiriisocius marinus]|uniref:Glycosyl transferase family 2 n=1 Tax=Patiriisocius marinus TaxID=1397112 RepID=A0A5J4J4P6_9FLAO|nr:glycosyltransferase [Patiriisocius marinus]GER60863.1 glycosyl transferase family 2 [Patiriisocius marinus]